jgi:hypothetical protein
MHNPVQSNDHYRDPNLSNGVFSYPHPADVVASVDFRSVCG